MITVLMSVVIVPGHEEDWEQVWQRARELHLRYPGFRTSQRLRDVDRPDHFVVRTEWEGRAEYNAFVRDMGLSWIDAALGLLVGPPTVTYLENVEDPTTL